MHISFVSKLFFAALLSLSSYVHAINDLIFSPRQIIDQPVECLTHIKQVQDAYYDELDLLLEQADLGEIITQYPQLLEKYTAKHPLFLLRECAYYGLGLCSLSRAYVQKYRRGFEDKVVEGILNALQDQDEVHYVSFASGLLFQDLQILLKLLEQKSDAVLHLNFIDPKYRVWAICLQLLQRAGTDDLLAIQDELCKVKNDDMPSDEFVKNMCIEYLEMEARLNQYFSFLEQHFPEARFSAAFYDDIETYLSNEQEEGFVYPDIIAAADIEDGYCLRADVPEQYALFCKRVLQKKPDVYNILLARLGGYFNPVAFSKDDVPNNMGKLLYFSLEANEGNTFFVCDNTHMYVKAETISPVGMSEASYEVFERLIYNYFGFIRSLI